MQFHVGSDHGGVTLLDVLVEQLGEWSFEVLSRCGPATPGERVDYPHVAVEVCQRVLHDRDAGSAEVFGLLVCGTGQGMAMTANKIPGIRAGVVVDVFSAKMIRAHNDANVLCLGERVLGAGLAKLLVRQFIDASFEGGRHAQRVALNGSLTAQPFSPRTTPRSSGEGS